MKYRGRLEYAHQRRIRTRNTGLYRVLHWPIWIWVFFLSPGPLTFSLFARGFTRANGTWLAMVMLGTGVAGLAGQLPGAEPAPYILRFDEDKPNPLYRRLCYTFAWNAVLNFALLNLAGLLIAVATGTWYMKQIYTDAYFPVFAVVLALGSAGLLPRVGPSTQGEGTERRYFYGAVWSVTAAQAALLLAWKTLPDTRTTASIKLLLYLAILCGMGLAARSGVLPRTRPILPGDLMIAD